MPIAAAIVFSETGKAHWPGIEKAEVLLLREQLGKISTAGRCEQVGNEQFALAGGFEPQIVAIGRFA